MLASLERVLGHGKMLRVGRANVDGIDPRIAQHIAIVGRNRRDGEASSHVLSRFSVSAGDGGSFDELHAPQGFEMYAAHKASAEDCRSYWFHVVSQLRMLLGRLSV